MKNADYCSPLNDLARRLDMPKEISKLLLLVCLFLSSCSFRSTTTTPTAEPVDDWNCEQIPDEFQVSNLIGSWVATYGSSSRVDKLVMKADGTYMQIFSDSSTGYSYQSPWNQWSLEHRSSGGIYLHLEGMLYCDLVDVCRKPEDELGNFPFFEICEERYISPQGELILVVVGDEALPGLPASEHGIALMHLRPPARIGPTFRFTLQTDE